MPDIILEKDPVILSSVQCLWLDHVTTVWVSPPLFAHSYTLLAYERLFALWLNSSFFGGGEGEGVELWFTSILTK